MTDTAVLDAMMKTLERNPLSTERMRFVDRQFVPADDRPFYANKEVEETPTMNRRFKKVMDAFHGADQDRLERPRRGACSSCGGTVHAVETKVKGAVRVDGRCLSCGWEVHRAGFLKED